MENVSVRSHSKAMPNQRKFGVGAYLSDLRKRSGLTHEELAQAAGYRGPSSIQTHTKSDKDKLEPKVAKRFAKVLLGKGSPPIQLEDLARLIGATLEGPFAITDGSLRMILELPVETKSATAGYIEPAEAGRLPIMGSAHASFWMVAPPAEDEPEGWLTIPFMSTKPLPNQYAVRIIGPSVNRTALEGDFAICARYCDAGSPLPEGKFVHAERERGGEFEWTLKKVRWTPEGALLCPDSDHPDHQKPLAFGSPGDRVTIRGIVIGWYRPA